GEAEEIVVRKTAVDALVKLTGPEHAEAGRALFPLLESADAELARGAAFVLAGMGGDPALKAMPGLRKAPDEEDPAGQTAAAGGADAGRGGAGWHWPGSLAGGAGPGPRPRPVPCDRGASQRRRGPGPDPAGADRRNGSPQPVASQAH